MPTDVLSQTMQLNYAGVAESTQTANAALVMRTCSERTPLTCHAPPTYVPPACRRCSYGTNIDDLPPDIARHSLRRTIPNDADEAILTSHSMRTAPTLPQPLWTVPHHAISRRSARVRLYALPLNRSFNLPLHTSCRPGRVGMISRIRCGREHFNLDIGGCRSLRARNHGRDHPRLRLRVYDAHRLSQTSPPQVRRRGVPSM